MSQRLYQLASLIFIGLSVFIMVEAQNLNYYTPLGPGPGFFPFWLGLSMAILSLVWLGQATFQPVDPIERPERIGAYRIFGLLIALSLFTALLNPLGFRLAMFGFLLFVLFSLGRQNLAVTLVAALLGSFGVHYVFSEWLNVRLPMATIEILENFGL